MTPLASTAEPRTQDQMDLEVKAGEEEELALRSKNPEAAKKLWEGLFKTRGFEMKSGKLMRSPSKRAPTKSPSGSSSRPSGSNDQLQDSSKSTLNSAFSRTKSFAHKPVLTGDLKPGESRQKHRGAISQPNKAVAPIDPISDRERKLFEGVSFRALGSADEPHIAEAIEARGGTFVSASDSAVDVILVRLSQ